MFNVFSLESTFRRRHASRPRRGLWKQSRRRHCPATPAEHWPVSYHGRLGVPSCRTCRFPNRAGAPSWPLLLTRPPERSPVPSCGTTCWKSLSHPKQPPAMIANSWLWAIQLLLLLIVFTTHLQFKRPSRERCKIIAVLSHSQHGVVETILHVRQHSFVGLHAAQRGLHLQDDKQRLGLVISFRWDLNSNDGNGGFILLSGDAPPCAQWLVFC